MLIKTGYGINVKKTLNVKLLWLRQMFWFYGNFAFIFLNKTWILTQQPDYGLLQNKINKKLSKKTFRVFILENLE